MAATYGIDKISTTATYASLWRSEMFQVGRKFHIVRIRIPLSTAVAANMSIVPKLYFDDIQTSLTLPTISTALYSGAKKIVYYETDLEQAIGENNYLLELNWAGTVELAVGFPIEIDRDVYDDETNQ